MKSKKHYDDSELGQLMQVFRFDENDLEAYRNGLLDKHKRGAVNDDWSDSFGFAVFVATLVMILLVLLPAGTPNILGISVLILILVLALVFTPTTGQTTNVRVVECLQGRVSIINGVMARYSPSLTNALA